MRHSGDTAHVSTKRMCCVQSPRLRGGGLPTESAIKTDMLAQRLFRSCAAPARALCTAGAGGLARRITTSGSALGSRVQPSTMLSVSSGSASSPLLLLSRGHRSSVVRAVIGSSAASVPRRVAPIATRRLLCTPAGGAQERAAAGVSLLKQFASWANQNRSVVGVLVAACCVMYGFYRGSIRLMKFFFNVTDKQIFEIGFLVGLLTAVVVIVSGVLTHRHLNLHIDEARPQPAHHTASPPARAHHLTSPPSAGFSAGTGRCVYYTYTAPLRPSYPCPADLPSQLYYCGHPSFPAYPGRPLTRPSGISASIPRSTRRWAASGPPAASRASSSSPGRRRSRAASGACALASTRPLRGACRWSSR